MNTLKQITLAALASLSLIATANIARASVSGLYYDHTGRSAIQVSPCPASPLSTPGRHSGQDLKT